MAHAVDAPPPTPVEPVTEILHGVEITDPYRWLEDQNSPRTRKWLDEQAAYTHAYFAAIPDREQIRTRVRELLAVKEVISEPWNVGDRYFFLKRQGCKEQPVIVMRKGLFGEETVLVDPALRATGTSTAVSIVAISGDARLLAYSVRQGGTDHSALEILDLERNTILPDGLPDGFCTGFAFAPDNSGFYYSHRQLHDPRPNYQAIFLHLFGTDKLEDQEVFFASEEPGLYLSILHSPEAGLLIYWVSRTGKQRHTTLYLDRMSPGVKPEILLRDVEGWFVPFLAGGRLLACTELSAPNRRIVTIDIDYPDPSHWRDVVPESDRRIRQFAVTDEVIVVTRIDGFSTEVQAFGLDGSWRGDIPFPLHGTVELPNGATSTDGLFISYTSICKPTVVHCYHSRGKEITLWDTANSTFDSSTVATEETYYPSKDGTSIPLFLAARVDLLHSGPLPTFLTGYGGFGTCVTPQFTALGTFLIEQGFLFAVPALRGGSELGEQWYRAARRGRRQNSFQDFISAAEWLVAKGRAIPGRVAIGGGSNAGLLVGAAITQRPDLFRAAICLGPLLDMIRYHLFDFAVGWEDEYGSPEDEQDFRYLLAYSPYHSVRKGAEYPAVLLISGDADTRCNPMHARKMAARLQLANTSGHPILLDYRSAWGHTPVQPLSAKIEALTDRLSFVCQEVGVRIQPMRSS
jgi:prolyl oligopeptidase